MLVLTAIFWFYLCCWLLVENRFVLLVYRVALVCARYSYRVAIYRMILHSCVLWLLALVEDLLQLLENLVLRHIRLTSRHGIVLHHSIVLLHRRILLALTSATQLVLRIIVLLASLF